MATKPGHGEIEIRAIGKTSSIATLSSSYPLRLISPPGRGHARAAMVFSLSFGGGLVAGDNVDMRVRVQAQARLALLTQGSTKVYKSPSREVCTEQRLTATVYEGAALLLLPDPVQPFMDSSYRQIQTVYMHPQLSNLLLLDWVSAGRTARGEAWDFFKWRGRNEVWSLATGDGGGSSGGCDMAGDMAGNNNSSDKGNNNDKNSNRNTGNSAREKRLLLRDNLVLDDVSPVGAATWNYRDAMDDLGVFGTLIIRGPVFHKLGRFFMQQFASLPRIQGKPNSGPKPNPSDKAEASPPSARPTSRLTWSATAIRGFVMVKFGAEEVDEAKRWLREMLRSDGTVEQEFGQHSLLCLQ